MLKNLPTSTVLICIVTILFFPFPGFAGSVSVEDLDTFPSDYLGQTLTIEYCWVKGEVEPDTINNVTRYSMAVKSLNGHYVSYIFKNDGITFAMSQSMAQDFNNQGKSSNYYYKARLTFQVGLISKSYSGAYTVAGLSKIEFYNVGGDIMGTNTIEDSNSYSFDGFSMSIWYRDYDGDGFGKASYTKESPSQPSGYVSNDLDCNDYKSDINPGATDIPGDGIDQDCDGADAQEPNTYYADIDGDGYGDPNNTIDDFNKPYGYVTNYSDCDDTDPAVHPYATEIANDGIDQDCNGYDLAAKEFYYQDFDGDGYGNPAKQEYAISQPYGYITDNTDCNDSNPNIHPGATEIKGDGIDQDCDGSDEQITVMEVYIYGPTNNQAMTYSSTAGIVTFSFTKITDAVKYVLNLQLNDMLNQVEIPLTLDLIPSSTPGLSESFLGMNFDLTLDTATWDVLALYGIKWGIEAYDNNDNLIGSTFNSGTAASVVYKLKFLDSNSVTMTSPGPGTSLDKSGTAPVFEWDTHPDSATYTVILAHVGSLGFDTIVSEPGLTLNLFPMSGATWQSMPTGTWYWTVFGYDANGIQAPGDFTIFDFEVQ